MDKRGLKIGTYDTAIHLWTLTGLELSSPELVTNYVDVPGRRQGPLDLSTVLTDGDPVYGSRKLSASFECSEGDRMDREHSISDMMNALDGNRFEITLPDDPLHFLVGRVRIAREYNTPAHASVKLEAVCEPWRYLHDPTVAVFQASAVPKAGTLYNRGRLSVVPEMKVSGGSVSLTINNDTVSLNVGTYYMPAFLTPPGGLGIRYSGTGVLTFTYREAVL